MKRALEEEQMPAIFIILMCARNANELLTCVWREWDRSIYNNRDLYAMCTPHRNAHQSNSNPKRPEPMIER